MSEAHAKLEDSLVLAVGDSALIAGLYALTLKNVKDKEAAIEELKDWMHGALARVYEDPTFPESMRDKIRGRVDHVLDLVPRFKT